MLLRDEIIHHGGTENTEKEIQNLKIEFRICFRSVSSVPPWWIYDSNPLYQPCRVGGVGFAGLHRVQQAAADALGFGDFIA